MDGFRNHQRTPCVIVGAGGHGRVVLDILMRARHHKVIGFLDFTGGAWDPALAFVMLGGVLVYAVGFRVVTKRNPPSSRRSSHCQPVQTSTFA